LSFASRAVTLPGMPKTPSTAGIRVYALVWTLVILLVNPFAVFAQGPPPTLPQGGQVVQGAATVATPAPGQLTVTQTSPRAVVNWNDFSIGAGGRVQFLQPDQAAAILNRVTGGTLSEIQGQLQANGQVYLLNEHGIVVGPDGTVDAASFVASTMRVADTDFMAGGPLRLTTDAIAGVVNLGTIRAAGGDVVLLAPVVVNQGTVAAPGGTAALASAGEVIYAPGGTDSVLIKAPLANVPSGTAIDNSGIVEAATAELKAAGSPYALAINQTGLVSATTLSNDGGRIVLNAGAGDVTVGAGAALRANASGTGNGGSVQVLADGSATFEGSIAARGGAQGGDGGTVEISGHRELHFNSGGVDTTAAAGRTGLLLLDPLVIDGTEAASVVTALDTSNVTETAADSITVSSPIVHNTTTNTLTLNAPVVAVNANITLPEGELHFGSAGTAGTSVTSAAGATISANLVGIDGGYGTVTFNGPIVSPNNGVSYSPTGGAPASFTATNASNQFKNLYFDGGNVSGSVDVKSTINLAFSGSLTVGGDLRIVSSGNVSANNGTAQTLTVAGTTTLASTGGVFINNGTPVTLAGAGRKLIYSSTDGGSFNAGGLGYTQVHGVSFPDDPNGSGNVIYFANGGLPSMTITADDKTISYGSADPTYTASYAGGTTSDLTTLPTFSVSGAHVNAGTYTIIPSGAASSTRTLTYVNGTLTIQPVVLRITADDVSRAYGSDNPSLGVSNSSLFNGDSLSSIVPNLSLSTSATPASNVGTYTITPSGSTSSGNYTLTFVPGTLRVTPAPLTVTGTSVTRTYGSANPTFEATFDGLVNGDTAASVGTLTLSTTATSASNIGVYAITPSVANPSSNYELRILPGTLVVAPAVLTIAVDDATRTYGDSNPSFSTTITGLVNGDTSSVVSGVTLSTAASETSNVGDYAITIAGGTAPNYDVRQRIGGTLHVTPAPLTIVASDASRGSQEPNPPFQVIVAGLKNDDTLVGLLVTSPAVNYFAEPGTYPINPTVGSMQNYLVTLVPGTLTVVPGAPNTTVTVTFEDGSSTPPALEDLETQAETTFNQAVLTATPEPVLISSNFFLGYGAGMVTAGLRVVDRLLADFEANGIKTTKATILQALDDPQTRPVMLATLMPYFDEELRSIILTRPDNRTAEQNAFLATMIQFIKDQKVNAALKAQADYDAWKESERARINDLANGDLGIAGEVLNQIEAANPEAAPPEYLASAKAGFIMTDDTAATLIAMNGQYKKMAEADNQTVQAGTNGSPSATAATVSPDDLQPITMASDLGKLLTFSTSAMDKTPEFVAKLSKLSGGNIWRKMKIVDTVAGIKGTVEQSREWIYLSSEIREAKDLGNVKDVAKYTKKLQDLEQAMQAIDDGAKVVSKVAKGARVVQVAGTVLSVAGVVLEVVGNAVQVGIAVAGYLDRADYEKQLSEAVQKAQTDAANLTEDTLLQMPPAQLFGYLSTALASGGVSPTVLTGTK
jgi:filamentous hemagglutinin family protein